VTDEARSRPIPWPRLTLEGLVIVVFILLAFAVDASWARARDAAAERLALQDLGAELADNVERIDRQWLPTHIGTAVATAQVLRALHGLHDEVPPPRQDGQDINAWYVEHVVVPISEHNDIVPEVTLPLSVVSHMTATQTYGPSIASLDVLIQAGGVASLRDPSLRALLAALPAELGDLTDEELFVRDVYYRDIRPRLVGVGNPLTVIEAMGDGYIGEIDVSEELAVREVTLQGSVQLSRALAKRLDLQVNVVSDVRRLRRRFDEIISHPRPPARRAR